MPWRLIADKALDFIHEVLFPCADTSRVRRDPFLRKLKEEEKRLAARRRGLQMHIGRLRLMEGAAWIVLAAALLSSFSAGVGRGVLELSAVSMGGILLCRRRERKRMAELERVLERERTLSLQCGRRLELVRRISGSGPEAVGVFLEELERVREQARALGFASLAEGLEEFGCFLRGGALEALLGLRERLVDFLDAHDVDEIEEELDAAMDSMAELELEGEEENVELMRANLDKRECIRRRCLLAARRLRRLDLLFEGLLDMFSQMEAELLTGMPAGTRRKLLAGLENARGQVERTFSALLPPAEQGRAALVPACTGEAAGLSREHEHGTVREGKDGT